MYCRLSFLIDFLTALIFCLYSSFRWISFCSLSSFPLICRLDSTSARELIQGLFSCFMRPSTVLLVSSFLKCLPNFVYILITFLHCLIVSKRFLGSSLNSSRLLLFESFFVLNFILADFLLGILFSLSWIFPSRSWSVAASAPLRALTSNKLLPDTLVYANMVYLVLCPGNVQVVYELFCVGTVYLLWSDYSVGRARL